MPNHGENMYGQMISLRSLLRFPYVHVYMRFTKLVLNYKSYDK
jgi:hypothetical protein